MTELRICNSTDRKRVRRLRPASAIAAVALAFSHHFFVNLADAFAPLSGNRRRSFQKRLRQRSVPKLFIHHNKNNVFSYNPSSLLDPLSLGAWNPISPSSPELNQNASFADGPSALSKAFLSPKKSTRELTQLQSQISIAKTKKSRSFLDKVRTSIVSPDLIEKQMGAALEAMELAFRELQSQQITDAFIKTGKMDSQELILFPTTRECNEALADWGDCGDLLRALRLFGKMRKAVVLRQQYETTSRLTIAASGIRMEPLISFLVPAPTLVTYSTLMSRAVKASKPRVALRMWKLLLNDPARIVPDIRAINILINAYAKIPDLQSACRVLQQMQTGHLGADSKVPLKANLVTYNTLLDACLKSKDLDSAIDVKEKLEKDGLRPDALTYTTLIATVARRPSKASGKYDASLAFAFLREMNERNISPNGMTYSALIDVAARCGRSDLALQGLRIMLRQKATMHQEHGSNVFLSNEVGAWTAAINACGKTGRLDTAIRLFKTMSSKKFGVKPNTVTCGCLTDLLLKAGRTSEALEVLRYMKENGIPPSEVMYTSLMTRAERLVQMEQRQQRPKLKHDDYSTIESGETKAIDVYTELMRSLMDGTSRESFGSNRSKADYPRNSQNDTKTLLLKVFLVFQEMKAAGASPDLACYNALLKACARAGDIVRAQGVLDQLRADGLDPNDTTWRHLVTAAASARKSDTALALWKQGIEYRRFRVRMDEPLMLWNPSVESFAALVMAFLKEASDAKPNQIKIGLYESVLKLYEALLKGNEEMGFDRCDLDQILNDQRTMLLILQAVVALDRELEFQEEKRAGNCVMSQRKSLRKMSHSILKLECFDENVRSGWAAAHALQVARTWSQNEEGL